MLRSEQSERLEASGPPSPSRRPLAVPTTVWPINATRGGEPSAERAELLSGKHSARELELEVQSARQRRLRMVVARGGDERGSQGLAGLSGLLSAFAR
jgi:hypothetical protein